jgi:hypothetical protein
MFLPFNGQQARLSVVRGVIERFRPDAFVETGTFIGSTTRFFCGNGVPVYTAERDRVFWAIARMRLGWGSGAHVVRGDSRGMLERLVNLSFGRPLIYLDAHWWADLPVSDEIRIVVDNWDDAVIVVDDFFVDDDPGYACDAYAGAALALDTISIPAGVMRAFPGAPSALETGARRGTLYLAVGADAAAAFGELIARGELRPAV